MLGDAVLALATADKDPTFRSASQDLSACAGVAVTNSVQFQGCFGSSGAEVDTSIPKLWRLLIMAWNEFFHRHAARGVASGNFGASNNEGI